MAAVDAAVAVGAERFVMISTDKAVNPSSIMGATKRLAEQYVQHVRARGCAAAGPGSARTGCSLVRFGNVLGSSGSALSIWARQVAEGGPVTVTHPLMTRYFMTIPEAASLVVQSAALHDPDRPGGEVFVLDMGEPVSILDLVRRFVEAHGLTARVPGEPDPVAGAGVIDVVFTGARPGEKLFEELSLDTESIQPTRHPGIRTWALPTPDPAFVSAMLDSLRPGVRPNSPARLAALIRGLIPEMTAPVAA
jgi:FlaA1/EpsC-like NDP-sugar epimerase